MVNRREVALAYDEGLNRRFRSALDGVDGITEKPMMGSVCFFRHGNMLGCATRKADARRFMFRVGKDNLEEALSRPGASVAELGNRRMGGFVFVDEAACDRDALSGWIALARSFVDQLPAK